MLVIEVVFLMYLMYPNSKQSTGYFLATCTWGAHWHTNVQTDTLNLAALNRS